MSLKLKTSAKDSIMIIKRQAQTRGKYLQMTYLIKAFLSKTTNNS